ncbi:glycosyltransferase family 4 protein [Candidatus Kuenenbacteria bacterium]|nr:glycosyltransferase family 4 protein [Candidatus Kuenenbacteria bacterium]
MKLIYFSNSRIPTEKGYGIQIMKMCHFLAAIVDHLELVIPTKKNKVFKNVDAFGYYQVEKNFILKKISCLDPSWIAKKMPQGIYIKVQAVFWLVSLSVYLLFKQNKNQFVAYTRDEYSLPVLQLFFKAVVWEAHTLPRNTKRYLKYWSKCHKIITITNGLKDELAGLGLDGKNILVAPDAVDLSEFEKVRLGKQELRQKLGLPPDKNIIAYTGHLYDWKGVQGLADAAKFLTEKEIIVFIGGSEEKFDLGRFRSRNEGNKRILILGYKPYAQMPLYLKAADVLVLPNSAGEQKSKSWTSPLKLFMYLASGTPIVAADLPSLTEILNKDNAVLYQPDDSAAMATSIQKVLTDPSLSTKISAKARSDVQAHTWQKRAEKIVAFIQS